MKFQLVDILMEEIKPLLLAECVLDYGGNLPKNRKIRLLQLVNIVMPETHNKFLDKIARAWELTFETWEFAIRVFGNFALTVLESWGTKSFLSNNPVATKICVLHAWCQKVNLLFWRTRVLKFSAHQLSDWWS